MIGHRLLKSCITFLFVLSLAYPLQTQAQQPQASNHLPPLNFPRRGTPIGRRRGGARRNGCPNYKIPLTAIVPGRDTNKISESFLTFTVSEYPTFWVYIPNSNKSVATGEFILQDENQKNLFKKTVMLPHAAGIIGINLPQKEQYSLKPDRKYQWYFKTLCDSESNTIDYNYVKAWIQRVERTPELTSNLKSVKPEQYITYAINGIWENAITNLAQLRLNNNSPSLEQDWIALFKAAGLSDLDRAPIITVYQF